MFILPEKYPKIAVDVVIHDSAKGILLVKRKYDPFAGFWALPGGMVKYGETVEHAAMREVMEETGVLVSLIALIGVYSDPDRDPRGHTISIAYLAKIKEGIPNAGSDASETRWFISLPEHLAFDHKRIISDAYSLINKGWSNK